MHLFLFPFHNWSKPPSVMKKVFSRIYCKGSKYFFYDNKVFHVNANSNNNCFYVFIELMLVYIINEMYMAFIIFFFFYPTMMNKLLQSSLLL